MWTMRRDEAWQEDLYYTEPEDDEHEDQDERGWRYGPDPDEAHDRMMDDRMEREAEES